MNTKNMTSKIHFLFVSTPKSYVRSAFWAIWEQTVEIGGMLKKYCIDHIRDLLQAEQDGRLVVLPCKVGDTVYQIDAERVYESEVKWIIFDCDDIAFDERAIGGSIFLTRDEAEAALKGGEG